MSRFDRAVIAVLGGLALVTAGLIWRGDQVGVTIAATTPPPDAAEVSRSAAIRATFSEDMAPGGPEPFTAEPPIAGSTVWDGRSITLQPETPLAPGTEYRVTVSAGLESNTGRALLEPYTWSFRTGETKVVFVARDAGDQSQLYTLPPGGGSPAPLTQALPQGLWDYAPSPDGSTIAVASMRPEGGSDIILISRDGRDRRVILACPDAECTGMAWAPDGQTLVYEKRNLPPAAGPVAPPRLWWLDVARARTADVVPEVTAGADAIGAASAQAVTVPVFADNQRLGFGARISPDGRRLAFTSPTQGTVEIHDLETGRETQIDSQTGEPAAWSPDSRSLLATGVKSLGERYVVHLLKASLDAAGESKLENLSGDDALVEDSAPAWSPDGQWVAFARREISGPGSSTGKQLWLMRADGSEPRRLTEDATVHFGPPAWSPDGLSLVFQSLSMTEPGADPVIGHLDVATGELRELAAPGSQPGWLP